MNPEILYNRIVVLLYNLLKTSQLRNAMKSNENFKAQIITQINSLLALEQDYKVTKDNEKFSLVFAQVIVNELNTEEQIEKPDNIVVDDLVRSYDNFVDLINNSFPNLNFFDNLNYSEIITKRIVLNLPNFINEQNIKAEKANNNEQINVGSGAERINIDPQQSQQSQNTTNNMNSNMNANFNQGMGIGQPQNPYGLPNMPVHPMMDLRYYPYKTKPKWMPAYKQLMFFTLFFLSAIILGLSFYMQLAHPFVVPLYKNNDNYYIDAGQGAEQVSLSISLFPGGIWTTIFIIAALGIFGFSVYGKRAQLKRERFHISTFAAVIGLIVMLYYLIQYVLIAIPGVSRTLLTSTFNSLKLRSHAGPPTEQQLVNDWITQQVNSIVGSSTYKNLQIVSLVFVVLAAGFIGMSIVLLTKNPRIDRVKLQKANFEYQKLLQAKFQGKDYQMDPSLFDEELGNSNGQNTMGGRNNRGGYDTPEGRGGPDGRGGKKPY